MPITLAFKEHTPFLGISGGAYHLWHYELSLINVVQSPSTAYVVQAGDTLWSIAAKSLNDPLRWQELWLLNRGQIADPNILFAGQRLQIPSGLGLENKVAIGISAQIDIKDPSAFPGVSQLSGVGLQVPPNDPLQYVTKLVNAASVNKIDFYFVAPSLENPSTQVSLASSPDVIGGWHSVPFNTAPSAPTALRQTMFGPAATAVARSTSGSAVGSAAPGDSSVSGLTNLTVQAKQILPYASEPFGVYQALLGWRSNLSYDRIASAVANRFAAATRLIGSSADLSVQSPIGTPQIRLATDRTGTAIGAQLAAHVTKIGSMGFSPEQWRSTLSASSSVLSLATDAVMTKLGPEGATQSTTLTGRSQAQPRPFSAAPQQFDTEAATATLLRYLGQKNPAIIETMFRPTIAPWERVIGAFSLFASDSPARNAFLSPIGLLHLFREYFFELGTFLGPPVGHVWISPGGTVELLEVNTRRQLVEQTIEQSTQTIQKTDTSQTQQDELSDAVKDENANDTKLGVTATASGGIAPVFQASGSSSLNLDTSRKQAQEQTHKQMREQSTKLSSEVRQNYKTTFRTVTETTDTSSRRYVIQNTTDRLVSYELSRKMRKVAVQVQDLGRQLCWQAFVDNPGDTLGLGEFVHSSGSSLDPGVKPPDYKPIPDNQQKVVSLTFPFNKYQGDDDGATDNYTPNTDDGRPDEGQFNPDVGKRDIIQFTLPITLPPPPPGFVLSGVGSIDFHGASVDFTLDAPDLQPNPNPAKNTLTIRLTHAFFDGKKALPFDVTLNYTADKATADAINASNNLLKSQYDDQVAAQKEKLFYDTLRERLKVVGQVKPRNQDDLREEERSIIYRNMISTLYGNETGWTEEDYHVASELIRYFFDVDAMLYFVAPDWWRPRAQQLVSKDNQSELQPTIIAEPAISTRVEQIGLVSIPVPYGQRPNYLITEETTPAPQGASLGWLIQLDGDPHRNAFLNSPWVKAVFPIRPGREREALAWLQNREIAGTDGLKQAYPFDPAQDPPDYSGLTIEEVLLKIADQIAAEHQLSLTPVPVDKTGVNPEMALPPELVFAHGFDPLEGGINFGAGPFTVFSQWLEVLPTDQIVATEYSLTGL
jgi:hypothetical protein